MSEILSNTFKDACNDYLYLLDKNYSEKAVIKIVQDKYKLSGLERSVLQRGIVNRNTASKRRIKILQEKEIQGNNLLVDFFNILLTIYSYLNGNFVYIACDGFLRDASESHGNFIKNKNFIIAIELIFKYLYKIKFKKITFYIDSPVSKSKELFYIINDKINEYKIDAETELVKSADYYLIKSKNEISATSDSNIIDKVEKVYDLSFNILKDKFNKKFFNLREFF